MKRVTLLIVAISLIVSAGCTKREDLVVAEVDARRITVADFEEAVMRVEEKYLPVTDDLEGRKEFLEHMINKEIMSLKARAAGYEKEEWFVNFWDQFKGPFLITVLMDHFVARKVVVSDEEVEDYYKQMHYEYTLSQIVLAEEGDAWDLREKILSGADFADMARLYSLGSQAANGGFIGSSPVGRIHYWVEEALFGMNEGDVSEPLRTTSGYALIKLHRKVETEPAYDKEWARKRVRAIKEKKGMQELKAKIEDEIELVFFTEAVTAAFNTLPADVPFEDIVNYKVTRKNAPKLQIPEEQRDMIICQYVDGKVTLEDFEELYEKLALPERPRRQYGRENVIQTIHKTIFDKVLPVYAEQTLKILEIPEVHDAVEAQKDKFLVHKLYQDQVRDESTVTEKEIRDYYDQHREEFRTAEQRDFSILVVGDQQEAANVSAMAKSGEDLSKLARRFSDDASFKENLVRTGLVSKGQYPDYDDVAFLLPNEGDVSAPIATPRGWAVVKIEKIEEGREPEYSEAYSTIRRTLVEKRSEEVLLGKLAKWREEFAVKVHTGNLKKTELGRTRI